MKPKKWKRLVEARKRANYTQAQMAVVCGVATSTFVRWENLEFEPSLAQIKTISQYLNVPVDWLIGNIEFDAFTDLEYWKNVMEARDLIRGQVENPASFFSANKQYADRESIISWVVDRMRLPANYFAERDLLIALPDELRGSWDDNDEADEYFPIIPLKISEEELRKTKSRKK